MREREGETEKKKGIIDPKLLKTVTKSSLEIVLNKGLMAPLQDRNVPHAEGTAHLTTHCADASQLCGEGLACPPSFVKSPAEILILILFQNTSQVLLLRNKGYQSGMLITQKILQL